MRVLTRAVLYNFSDVAGLSCSVTLDNHHVLPKLETLADLESSNHDFERLRAFSGERDESVIDMSNESLATFELAIVYFDSLSDLELDLWIVLDGF